MAFDQVHLQGCQNTGASAMVTVNFVMMTTLPLSTAFSLFAGLFSSPLGSAHILSMGVPSTVVPVTVALGQHWPGCRGFQAGQVRPRVFCGMGCGLGSYLIHLRSCTVLHLHG